MLDILCHYSIRGNGMVNIYELLGLTYDASENQIRQSIMQHHSAGTLDNKVLEAAKNWLLNSEIRAKYDLKLKQEHPDFFTKSMFDMLDTGVANPVKNKSYQHQIVEENIAKSAIRLKSKSTSSSPISNNEDYQYRVNKVAFCLLAFFLGGFGVHWFVAGKWKLGLCYLIIFLLFFSIPFLLWIVPLMALIDFIVGLTKKSDENGYIYYNESWFG